MRIPSYIVIYSENTLWKHSLQLSRHILKAVKIMACFHLLNKKTPSVTVTYSGKFWWGHQPAIWLYACTTLYCRNYATVLVLVKGRRTCIIDLFGFLTFQYTQSTWNNKCLLLRAKQNLCYCHCLTILAVMFLLQSIVFLECSVPIK